MLAVLALVSTGPGGTLTQQLILAAPDAIIDNALTGWGSAPSAFPVPIREAYIEALRNPARVHAICEDYRAAATLDDEQDQADRAQNRHIQCPLLVLWGQNSVLNSWYQAEGGPVAVWQKWTSRVAGQAIPGGHFFPEESFQETAQVLREFLRNHDLYRIPPCFKLSREIQAFNSE